MHNAARERLPAKGMSMARDRFDACLRRGATLGQRRLADSIRRLIYRADETLFDRLDFRDDNQFLHPLLFAYFTDPSPSLELPQLLYGHLPPDSRPDFVRLNTDPSGRASLGRIGNIETLLPSAALDFGRKSADEPYNCLMETRPVPFELRSPMLVPGTRIEVTTDLHPVLYRFFDTPDVPMTNSDAVRVPRDRVAYLLVALALLRTHCPGIWADIAAVTRMIVLYRATAPYSFAALSAHGAIFCNVADDHDDIALLEDVTHQAAHVIFNAFTHDPMRVLAIDPETPLRTLCGDPDEVRSLYEALHGLFTYTLICKVLSAVDDAGVLPERQSDELLGRLGFTLRKFAADVERLNLPDSYTLIGRRCYTAFVQDYHRFYARYGAKVDGFAFDNQLYEFSYTSFVERNGGPWPCSRKLAS
jgi:hypothetical protein